MLPTVIAQNISDNLILTDLIIKDTGVPPPLQIVLKIYIYIYIYVCVYMYMYVLRKYAAALEGGWQGVCVGGGGVKELKGWPDGEESGAAICVWVCGCGCVWNTN